MANPSIRVSEFRQTESVADDDQLVVALSKDNRRAMPIQIYEYFKNRLLTDPDFIAKFLDMAYPVGSVYMTFQNSNPLEKYGFMNWKWTEISRGRCLEGAPDPDQAGGTLEAGMPPAPDDIQIDAGTFQHTHRLNDPGHRHMYYDTESLRCHWSTDWHTTLGGSESYTGMSYTGISIGKARYVNQNFKIEIKPGNSEIYGKSDTVQPKAVLARIYKRVS